MMITSGRSGYYFRVIEEGVVDPGAAIQQVESGAAEWSVARTFQLLIGGGHKAANADAALRDLSALSTLAENWRARALRLLG